jgi:hypothetical protein
VLDGSHMPTFAPSDGPGAIEAGGNFVFRSTLGAPYFTSGIYGARMIGP